MEIGAVVVGIRAVEATGQRRIGRREQGDLGLVHCETVHGNVGCKIGTRLRMPHSIKERAGR